jgi:hypothetical protein
MTWNVAWAPPLKWPVGVVFIATNQNVAVGKKLLAMGAPDNVRCAATSSGRWVLTVGPLSCGPAWLSGGAPDRPCRLSGVPPTRALLLCARRRAFNALQSTVEREVVVAPPSHRTVRCAPDTVR